MYQADVKNPTDDEKNVYLGVTGTPFEERFGNRTQDFKYRKYKTCAEISKYIWNHKDANISSVIEWSIVMEYTFSKSSKVFYSLRRLCFLLFRSIVKCIPDPCVSVNYKEG